MDHLPGIVNNFVLDGNVISVSKHGSGHIHDTYMVKTDKGTRYILQRMNEVSFGNIRELMENVVLITEYLRKQQKESDNCLRVIPLNDGTYWFRDETGAYRMFNFIDNSISLDQPESPSDFYESAVGIRLFQQALRYFPVERLHESIPNFHNTPNRYRIFHEILIKDPLGRSKDVQREIDFFLSHEDEMRTLQKMREEGTLPTIVTHNDTKLNNILLDKTTRKAKCVIDLDTVMPGLSLYDYGDSIRFGASTAAEDEKDLSKVGFDLNMFNAYTEGFILACPGLTDTEIEMLLMGIKTMTCECGLRFLTDYIDGDRNFSIHYSDQNLDRTRTQIKLIQDLEEKWPVMEKMIQKISAAV